MRRFLAGFLVAVVCVFVAGSVYADGFRNPPDGATAIGRIGGRIAQIDDASTVSHNPANMMDLKEPVAAAALTLGYATKELTTPQGASEESEEPWAMLPSLYGILPSKDGKYTFGIGVISPFGRSAQFDEDGMFRYTSPYYSQLRSINANPAVATRIGDSITVAVGVDVLWSDLDLRQYYPWSAAVGAPVPDGKATFDADGVGLGANAGVTWQMTPKQRLAVTYRSPIEVDYEGDFEISNIPGPIPGITPRSDFETSIDFPSVVGLGYGIEVTDTVRVEFDVEWVEASRFQELALDIGTNGALLPSTVLPANYEDNWTFGVGGDWKFAPNWMLRAGYIYLETPVPEETMIPSVAEEDQSVISVGLGYNKGANRVDLAYAIGLFDGRTVDENLNPAFLGDYDFESHLISMTYSRAF
jgi:long-chain fatty acid transport protein